MFSLNFFAGNWPGLPRNVPICACPTFDRCVTHGLPFLSHDEYWAPLGGSSGRRSSAKKMVDSWLTRGWLVVDSWLTRGWLELDSWLELGLGSRLARVALQLQRNGCSHPNSIPFYIGCVPLEWSGSGSVWIMVHQRNRRIHSGHGFAGSFDAPWSKQILDDWSGSGSPQRNVAIVFVVCLRSVEQTNHITPKYEWRKLSSEKSGCDRHWSWKLNWNKMIHCECPQVGPLMAVEREADRKKHGGGQLGERDEGEQLDMDSPGTKSIRQKAVAHFGRGPMCFETRWGLKGLGHAILGNLALNVRLAEQ